MPEISVVFENNTNSMFFIDYVMSDTFNAHLRATNEPIIAGPYMSTMALPATPVLHPYNPLGDDRQQRINAGTPQFPVVVKLESANYTSFAKELGVDQLDVFIVMQTNAWEKNVPILFRPHPWLHPEADEKKANYNHASNVDVAFCFKKSNFEPIQRYEFSSHSGEGNEIVYSPNNAHIKVEHTNSDRTNIFYSVCRDGKRAALTLHVLLNDVDHEIINNVCETMKNNEQNQNNTLLSLLKNLNNHHKSTVDLESIVYFCSGIVPPLSITPEFNEFLTSHNNVEKQFNTDNVNETNSQQETPLALSIIEHNPLVFAYLIRCGANVDHIRDDLLLELEDEQKNEIDDLRICLNKLR